MGMDSVELPKHIVNCLYSLIFPASSSKVGAFIPAVGKKLLYTHAATTTAPAAPHGRTVSVWTVCEGRPCGIHSKKRQAFPKKEACLFLRSGLLCVNPAVLFCECVTLLIDLGVYSSSGGQKVGTKVL